MKQLLEYIVPNIVNHPEAVEIQESQDADSTVYLIKVDPEDMGRVIGKSGKVIKAIRQLAKIIAIKKGIRVRVDVWEENKPSSSQSQDSSVGGDIDIPSEPVVETTPEPVAEEE